MNPNLEEQGFEPCLVRCYSGRTYAQRPEVIVKGEEMHRVSIVKKEWQEPGLRRFIVLTEAGTEFHLGYDEQQDAWWLRELVG